MAEITLRVYDHFAGRGVLFCVPRSLLLKDPTVTLIRTSAIFGYWAAIFGSLGGAGVTQFTSVSLTHVGDVHGTTIRRAASDHVPQSAKPIWPGRPLQKIKSTARPFPFEAPKFVPVIVIL
jgi:hypothetical protein